MNIRKEAEYTRLIAEGYEPSELRWIPTGSPAALELVFVHGQNPDVEMKKAIDKAQAGQWVISKAGVERVIRKVPGCGTYSVDETLKPLLESPFFGVAHGARH